MIESHIYLESANNLFDLLELYNSERHKFITSNVIDCKIYNELDILLKGKHGLDTPLIGLFNDCI